MRVLGIDPGLSITGYGCVELRDGADDPVLIEGGVLRLKSRESMAYRLAQLHVDLLEVLDDLKPDVMVVEQLFSQFQSPDDGIIFSVFKILYREHLNSVVRRDADLLINLSAWIAVNLV